MSDDDLFADSGDDTDELIAGSKDKSKPVAKPKKLKKKSAPLAKKRKRDIPGMLVTCLSYFHRRLGSSLWKRREA